MLVNVPTLLDPSMAPDGRHVFSLEALFTPFGLRGGWPDSTEPWRWLEAFAGLCEPGFLDSIVEWRAMTPDVYERDFHLPAGHATSFAGGPLAAFRNREPRADQVRDRGRRVCTSPARRPSPAPVCGARAAATAPPSSSNNAVDETTPRDDAASGRRAAPRR